MTLCRNYCNGTHEGCVLCCAYRLFVFLLFMSPTLPHALSTYASHYLKGPIFIAFTLGHLELALTCHLEACTTSYESHFATKQRSKKVFSATTLHACCSLLIALLRLDNVEYSTHSAARGGAQSGPHGAIIQMNTHDYKQARPDGRMAR